METLVLLIWVVVGLGCAAWTIATLEGRGRRGTIWQIVGFAIGMLTFQAPLLIWGFVIDTAIWEEDRPLEWFISIFIGLVFVFVLTKGLSKLPGNDESASN